MFFIMERGRPARKKHEAGETPALQCSFTPTILETAVGRARVCWHGGATTRQGFMPARRSTHRQRAPGRRAASLSRPCRVSLRSRKKAKKNRRRFAPESVRPLSPLPGHSPPPSGGEQASAEARFGGRRVRYPPLSERGGSVTFLPSPPWGGVARSAGRGGCSLRSKATVAFSDP
jgi:hypothetical protein